MKIMRDKGFEPLEPYPGKNRRPWRSRCTEPTCGQISFPTLTNVKGGSACRYCCNHGLNWGAPAIVYLVSHKALRAHKPGITGLSTDRLPSYRRLGWDLIYTSPQLPTGTDAYGVEQAVKRRLVAEHGAVMPFLTKNDLPQNGYKETLAAEIIRDLDLVRLIEEELGRLTGFTHRSNEESR